MFQSIFFNSLMVVCPFMVASSAITGACSGGLYAPDMFNLCLPVSLCIQRGFPLNDQTLL
jgi:hypothetical protein